MLFITLSIACIAFISCDNPFDSDEEKSVDIDPNLIDWDEDGIIAPAEQCPDAAETFNQYRDDDGCPDTIPASISSDKDGDNIADAFDRCPEQAENINGILDGDGCPDSPTDLYTLARSDIESFWVNQFNLIGPPAFYRPLTQMISYGPGARSACGPLIPGNAYYCPIDGAVYLDQVFLASQINMHGDMGAVVIIAHEIGHHVSALLNWIKGFNITTKQYELQADCFAGAYVKNAGLRGILDIDDLQQASQAVYGSGDPNFTWFDPNAHGTSFERLNAFGRGFSFGFVSCTDLLWLQQFPLVNDNRE